MKHSYFLTLGFLGSLMLASGIATGGVFHLATWLGGNFLLLALAHFVGNARIFGKRQGKLPFWSWIVFLPLHLLTHAVWHGTRLLSKEPAQSVVSEVIVIGRRPLRAEVQATYANIIDLTAEFTEPALIRRHPAYQSFPMLDGGAPRPEALREAILGLRSGKTFIHCAQGHGRSGLFALAMMLHAGAVKDVEEGLRLLQAARPGIRLSAAQRQCARDLALLLRGAHASHEAVAERTTS